MTKEDIDDTICAIMYVDGPDRHIDGHGVITEFIMALRRGDGHEWRVNYATANPSRYLAHIVEE